MDEDMVDFELEAAEALAGISRVSQPSQDPAKAGQHGCASTSNTVAEYETTVQTAGNPPKGKSKQSSDKAEQEARKLRRILANRESARETIRRRKAMYIELTRKAADVTEENQNLKNEKEQAVAERNLLKDKNMFLKTQLAKVTNAETEIRQEEHKSSHGETSTPTANNPSVYLYNHPSLVPCFLSSVLPPSGCVSRPDIMSSSQFLLPCSHGGQENHMGPVFVMPVPWMLPFLAQPTTFPTNDQHSYHTYPSSETMQHQHSDAASNQSLRAEASGSGKNVHGDRFAFPPEANAACATERLVDSLSYREPERNMSPKKQEDVFAATEARRRRKQLMKLKK